MAVLDTPGCFVLTSELLEAACVVLLVVNVSSSFRDSQEEALEKQLEAAGARAWSRSMVLFSHGDWLGPTSIERRIESEGQALQRLVEKCGDRYHVLDNSNWGHGAQVEELMELMEQVLMEDRLDVCPAAAPQTEAVQEKSSGSSRRQLVQTRESNMSSVSLLRLELIKSSRFLQQPLPPALRRQDPAQILVARWSHWERRDRLDCPPEMTSLPVWPACCLVADADSGGL